MKLSNNKNRPLLTICIPTYNRAHYLRSSLYNWLREIRGFEDLVELVISDNASIDNTRQVVEEAAKQWPLKYNKNEKNIGNEKNGQRLFKFAEGDFCWIVGDDDLPLPGAVKKVLNVIKEKRSSVDFIFLNGCLADLDKNKIVKSESIDLVGKDFFSNDFQERYFNEIRDFITCEGIMPMAMYLNISRRERIVEAFNVDYNKVSKENFYFTILYFLIDKVIKEPCFYIGHPYICAGRDNTWKKHHSVVFLEAIPNILDLCREKGIPSEKVDEFLRSNFIHAQANVISCFFKRYSGQSKSFFWIVRNRIYRLFGWRAIPFLLIGILKFIDIKLGEVGLYINEYSPWLHRLLSGSYKINK